MTEPSFLFDQILELESKWTPEIHDSLPVLKLSFNGNFFDENP